MALDMHDVHRINMRIDDIKDWVEKRFGEIEDRRRSAQLRTVAALTVAIYVMLFYMLGRMSEVNRPGVACEPAHPTTGASPP